MESHAGMDPAAALTGFGFNQLESLLYCELLQHAPATGYRLAQLVGRAPANIYQALKALLQKGAVLIETDTAEATSYLPVPPDQLFATLRSRFSENASLALGSLQEVHRPKTRETLSQLRTASQVLERSRSMIAATRETIVFDCVPEIYDLLRADLDAARARGVIVAGIAYRPEDVLPTMPFKGEPTGEVRKRWPGLGLILVTDAIELVIAQISTDMKNVLNAIHSDSAFLSCILHGLLTTDIRLVEIAGDAGYVAPPPMALDAFALQAARPPGLRALLG